MEMKKDREDRFGSWKIKDRKNTREVPEENRNMCGSTSNDVSLNQKGTDPLDENEKSKEKSLNQNETDTLKENQIIHKEVTRSMSKNNSSGQEEIDECEKKTKEMKRKIIRQHDFNATFRFEKEVHHLRIRGPKKHDERTRTLLENFERLMLRIKKTNSMSEILEVEEQINNGCQQLDRIAEEIWCDRRIRHEKKEFFRDFNMSEYVRNQNWE